MFQFLNFGGQKATLTMEEDKQQTKKSARRAARVRPPHSSLNARPWLDPPFVLKVHTEAKTSCVGCREASNQILTFSLDK